MHFKIQIYPGKNGLKRDRISILKGARTAKSPVACGVCDYGADVSVWIYNVF